MASFDQSPTVERKQAHLELCKNSDVESLSSAGWEKVRLPHIALPELNFKNVSTQAQLVGRTFSAPILISSMTGGTREGETLNQTLARFAEEANIPMGVGSQRVALESRDAAFFDLRRAVPKATLFANIGLVQLNHGVTPSDLSWLVENLKAQALILHANVLQEAIQEEGDRDFSNLFFQIEKIKKEVSVPLILKETGCGLDPISAKRALDAGIDVLDVAGLGGTHWGFIEGLRSSTRRQIGEIFRDWGRPTAQALVAVRAEVGNRPPVIASGGLRNGLDMAKALFLGADFCGMALPFLKIASAHKNEDTAIENLLDFFQLQTEALKIALFCMGTSNLSELKKLSSKQSSPICSSEMGG
jgi:isopentenyl-diphosphate delta-isomerase